MNRDFYYLNLLCKIAENTDFIFRSRHISAIVYHNNLISIGINEKKTSPFQKRFCGGNQHALYLHAETSSITKALRVIEENDLKNSSLYVARIKYSGGENSPFMWGLSKPCVGCQKAIIQYQIKRVVYTGDGDGKYYYWE
jgi:deoxycytidylate deaminase